MAGLQLHHLSHNPTLPARTHTHTVCVARVFPIYALFSFCAVPCLPSFVIIDITSRSRGGLIVWYRSVTFLSQGLQAVRFFLYFAFVFIAVPSSFLCVSPS